MRMKLLLSFLFLTASAGLRAADTSIDLKELDSGGRVVESACATG